MKLEDLIITRYGVKKQIEHLIKHRQELDQQINKLKEDETKTNEERLEDGSKSETDKRKRSSLGREHLRNQSGHVEKEATGDAKQTSEEEASGNEEANEG